MIDGALEYEGYPFIFEFKTINPKDFEYLIEPLQDHIKQGAMYSLCTGIRKVMFLYLCKGTQNLKAFTVDYRDDQLQWVINKIRGVEEKVLKNELPDKEFFYIDGEISGRKREEIKKQMEITKVLLIRLKIYMA